MARKKVIPVAELKAGVQDVVFDLPAATNEGIGKLIMTHAILETQVSELLYDVAEITYPAGRVAFGYRSAGDRFSVIINLLDMHGITPSIDLNELHKQIKDCCDARDTFAHNVWLKDKNGMIGIRVAKGTLETPDGKHNLKFVPAGHIPPDNYFPTAVETIKSAIAQLMSLKDEVKAKLVMRK